MLDLARITIPLKETAVICPDDPSCTAEALEMGYLGKAKILEYVDELRLGARSLFRGPDGSIQYGGLAHSFESLPTWFSGIAIRLNNHGHCWPHIEMKASPAKIIQGHNVFGDVSLEQVCLEFYGTLREACPSLFEHLDFTCAQFTNFDITYTMNYAEPGSLNGDEAGIELIRFFHTLHGGQLKPAVVRYLTTAYWNKDSDQGGLKAYLKYFELMKQLKGAKKEAKQGLPGAQRLVDVLSDTRLQNWSRFAVRMEASFTKDFFRRHKFPVFVRDWIAFEENAVRVGRCWRRELWEQRTKPLFAACEGQSVKIPDDKHVELELYRVHVRYTKSGNVSYSHAANLLSFYRAIRESGYTAVRKSFLSSPAGRRLFDRRIEDMELAGFAKGTLQAMELNTPRTNVVPVLRMMPLNFTEQMPDWAPVPVSRFDDSAVPTRLRLVA